MPLILARAGEVNIIKRVGGDDVIRHFLGDRGFVPGADVVVISEFSGNLIVNIKGSKIAITKEMAKKVII
jgi:ferrous iron transport protein A